MTTTMGETDTDLTLIFEHDFDVPCDVTNSRTGVDCDRAADWALRLACCGRVMLHCDFHFQRLLEYISEGYVFNDPPERSGCGAKNIDQPILSAERLEKKS